MTTQSFLRLRSVLALLLAFILLTTACGSDTDTSEAAQSEEPTDVPEAEEPEAAEPTDVPEAEDPEAGGSGLAPADAECPVGRATEVADDQTPLRIVLLPVVGVAPVVYGVECGFFAKHGLEVTTETASDGPAAAQLVAAGEAELGISAWHPLSAIWVNGGPFVVAIDGSVLQPAEGVVVVSADSDIETLADLDGKTVANAAPGSFFEVAFKAALQDEGIAVDGPDLVVVPITEQIAAVLSGSVDAAVLTEPFTTIAKAQGLKVVVPDLFSGRIAEGSSGGFAALAPWAAENEATILQARAAWNEVVALFNADEAAYRSFLPSFTALTPELAEVIVLSEYRTTTEVANIQPAVDLTAAVGVIPETLDVGPFVVAPE